MSYRLTTYEAIQDNLSAATITVMLCRANLEQVDLSEQDKADMLWRIECQISELEGMRTELARLAGCRKNLSTKRKFHLRPVE
ncbi:hypothetical protein GIY56_12615 [Paracoccus sp. YIM 132242]|uniref:Uncharacterized protein n=1 Tax=Paracoccus lichenicola TaxID=2665644 RepID=A0A6L6HS30_9RHOB|nr:hypothetical protein [Paracoccus lichenicola]MTE01131.1 hypothetical protein [Paracoccus lichenicola]